MKCPKCKYHENMNKKLLIENKNAVAEVELYKEQIRQLSIRLAHALDEIDYLEGLKK
ncbi:MAG: hypothetical protein Q8P24_02095 [Desulfobacterales bacterium]|nr:hypothetical protein [Desulfobacterales bacterium]